MLRKHTRMSRSVDNECEVQLFPPNLFRRRETRRLSNETKVEIRHCAYSLTGSLSGTLEGRRPQDRRRLSLHGQGPPSDGTERQPTPGCAKRKLARHRR